MGVQVLGRQQAHQHIESGKGKLWGWTSADTVVRIISGYPWIMHGYSWFVHELLFFWCWFVVAILGNFWLTFRSNCGELQDQPRIISSTILDDALKCLFLISGVNPGSIWEYFGSILDCVDRGRKHDLQHPGLKCGDLRNQCFQSSFRWRNLLGPRPQTLCKCFFHFVPGGATPIWFTKLSFGHTSISVDAFGTNWKRRFAFWPDHSPG